jgi:hypothetical protein
VSDHQNPVPDVENADSPNSSEIQLGGMKHTSPHNVASDLAVSHPEKLSGEIVIDLPASTWNLDQIAKFVNHLARRRAVDAWQIGTALNFAKEQQKGDKDFVAWLQAKVPFSTASAYRYMRLAKRLSQAECEDRDLNYVYHVIEQQIAEEKTANAAKTISITVGTLDAPNEAPAEIESSDLETKESEIDDEVETQPLATKKKFVAVTEPKSKNTLSGLTWAVAEEPETEIEQTLEKFQRSVDNVEVPKLTKQQKKALRTNLTNLNGKIGDLLLKLAA